MHRFLFAMLVAALLGAACTPIAPPTVAPTPRSPTDNPITIVTWNLEGEDAQRDTLSEQIAEFEGVDLWVFQEAFGWKTEEWLAQAAGVGESGRFAAIKGTTGMNIPLVTVFDEARFDLLGWEELDEVNFTGTVRAPLVLHLLDEETGVEFLLMNNHLYRTQEDDRDHQAHLLNEWARTQRLPVVAGGDYNFDYDIPDGPSALDRGYDNLTRDDVWQWIQPDHLVPTQCSESLPCPYDDVLDFVFVAGAARDWQAESTIVVRPGDFPDDRFKSDHRPVMATVVPE